MNLLEDLKSEDLVHRTIFIRVDFNVPLQSMTSGRYLVADDQRMRRFLDVTFKRIHHLTQGNCRIVIGSHLGRPHKYRDHSHWNGIFNLQFVCSHFETLLKKEYEDCYTVFPPETVGSQLTSSLEMLKGNQLPLGGIKFLPNLRYLLETESAYRDRFMEDLADMCDVYINCAFGTSHRESRSISALPLLMKKRGKPHVAGLLLSQELARLGEIAGKILKDPGQTVFIIGGSKVADKIGVLKEFARSRGARILLGGKMVNAFLLAGDFKAGPREIPEKLKPKDGQEETLLKEIQMADEIMEVARENHASIVFPSDYKTAPEFNSSECSLSDSPDFSRELQLDIGPKTVEAYWEILQEDRVKNIFWNGPLGAFDHPTNKAYAEGSVKIAQSLFEKCLQDQDALVVIGGGDSAAVVQEFDLAGIKSWFALKLNKMISKNINHNLFEIKFLDRDLYTFTNYFAKNFFISTGGGASLKFIEGFLQDQGKQPLAAYLPGTRVLQD